MPKGQCRNLPYGDLASDSDDDHEDEVAEEEGSESRGCLGCKSKSRVCLFTILHVLGGCRENFQATFLMHPCHFPYLLE